MGAFAFDVAAPGDEDGSGIVGALCNGCVGGVDRGADVEDVPCWVPGFHACGEDSDGKGCVAPVDA